MSRTKVVAALSGLLGMIAAAIVAVPAAAEPTTVLSENFNASTLGALQTSGGPTVSYVADPDDSSNTVVSLTDRANEWDSLQTASGLLVSGTVYEFSAKVRLAQADAASTTVVLRNNSTYASLASASVSGTAWTTLSGSYTPASEGVSVQFAATAGVDLLVDDVLITSEPPAPVECPAVWNVDFEDGTTGAWFQNGDATLTVQEEGDDSYLAITGRANGHDGIQSPSGVVEQDVLYTVSADIRPHVASDVHFIANNPAASNQWEWVANASLPANEWTTISGVWTFPDETSAAKFYLEASVASADYDVDNIVVRPAVCGDDGPEPGTVAISTDFEDGLDGWSARDSGTGAPTVAVTTADAHGGSQAALVSDRTSQGSGLRFDVTEALVAGPPYDLTAWIKFAETPTEDVWLTLENSSGGSTSYSTLAQFTGMSAGEWVQVTASFTMAPTEQAYIYFETAYEGGETGNTSAFMVDDITVVVPEPPVVQDLTPIQDTVDFPVGVAIDQRETLGAPSELLLKHFDQITPENFMKPEAWYDAEGNWAPNAAQIDSLMDFAQANDLGLYGHVLVWHSQTPAWFFQDEAGNPLTTSDADKQILRDRMRTHIDKVAEYLAQWGDYGDGNPLVAFDVVNEVIDDSAAYADGMRRSEWYRILGEEFVADAFIYAEAAFNGTHAADGVDRPVTLFINDYNTEQSGKRGRYLALVDRLLAADVPLDGIGHQFHVSLSQPVTTLDEALTDASTRGLQQAVTELDVTTGVPESTAKFIDQGYYYRDAFEIFRAHADQMYSVTVWGLNDARSWRDSSGGPLVFDDGFQAKPAYYGIVEPSGLEEPLPARLRTANSFAGDVPATAAGVASGEWRLLPLLPAGDDAGFQTRWAADHLSVYVEVDDAVLDEGDAVTVQVGDDVVTLPRGGGAAGAVVEGSGGYAAVVHVPLTDAVEGGTIQLDVRVTDGDVTSGWNTPGVMGTVTLVEALSHVTVPEAPMVPVIDGASDPAWSTSNSVQTIKQVSGTDGAIGTFRLMWKGQTLFVLAEVADPTVDVSGSDPWTQDSVEIYVDPGNAKNGSFRYDDTQIRINADNTVSFGSGDETFQANRVDSAAVRVDGGYVIEAAISLLEYGGLNTVHGLDVQVNDASGGARSAIRNWADPTGAGYQSTARWGVASLVEGSLMEQPAFAPRIKGSAVVGNTLSVTGRPSGTTLSYQWLRNGAVISGADDATYRLTSADAGKRISVRVTSVRAGYADLTVTSPQTSIVLKTFVKVTTPVIQGAVKVGGTVKAVVSPWSPKASYKYRWYSNGKPIYGAVKSTLKLTRAQAGTTITVKVTGSRAGYVSVTKTSVGKRVPLLKFAVNPTWLNGPTRVGGTLVVTPGASRPVTTTKTYQWYVNGKAVSGATKSTYVVTSQNHGKRITAKVTFRAKGYATKSVFVGPTYRITWR